MKVFWALAFSEVVSDSINPGSGVELPGGGDTVPVESTEPEATDGRIWRPVTIPPVYEEEPRGDIWVTLMFVTESVKFLIGCIPVKNHEIRRGVQVSTSSVRNSSNMKIGEAVEEAEVELELVAVESELVLVGLSILMGSSALTTCRAAKANTTAHTRFINGSVWGIGVYG